MTEFAADAKWKFMKVMETLNMLDGQYPSNIPFCSFF